MVTSPAYTAGQHAHATGAPISANPYPTYPNELLWRLGWVDAAASPGTPSVPTLARALGLGMIHTPPPTQAPWTGRLTTKTLIDAPAGSTPSPGATVSGAAGAATATPTATTGASVPTGSSPTAPPATTSVTGATSASDTASVTGAATSASDTASVTGSSVLSPTATVASVPSPGAASVTGASVPSMWFTPEIGRPSDAPPQRLESKPAATVAGGVPADVLAEASALLAAATLPGASAESLAAVLAKLGHGPR